MPLLSKRRILKLVVVSILFLPMLVYVPDWWYKEQVLSMKIKRMELRNVDRAVKRMELRNVDRAVKQMELPRAIAATGDTLRSNPSAVGEFSPPGSRPPITLSKGFIIENKNLCSQYVSLTYVVVVHTAPSHFERRESFRNTWARSGTYNATKSQTVFLIGMTLNEALQKDILSENKKNGDIVQGDFIDDYSNLTLKAVMGLKWITHNCPNAEYVIKVDDDVFINIFQVIKTVFPVLKANPKQVYCHAERKAYIMREGNGKKTRYSKWEVSLEFFKGRRRYPMPFCYGYATFYTTTFASELLAMAASTPFYRLDDVYVYGILVSKIEGASWHNARDRYFRHDHSTSKSFLRNKNSLVGTVRSVAGMYHMWKSISAL